MLRPHTALSLKANEPLDCGSPALFLLFFFFHGDDFASLVMPAIGAYGMRKPHLPAIAALNQVYSRNGIMRPAAITSALGMLALWMWNHAVLLYLLIKHS